jgi:hypothetical protein
MRFLFPALLITLNLFHVYLDLLPLHRDICANWKCQIFGLKIIFCKGAIMCMTGTMAFLGSQILNSVRERLSEIICISVCHPRFAR